MNKEERKQQEKEEAAAKRRSQILDAGKKLFAAKNPDEVTIAAIADECGLSPGTIYLYYKSKEDLLFHIMTEYITWGISHFKITSELSGMENLRKIVQIIKKDYMEDLPKKNLIAHFDFHYEKEYPDLPVVREFEKKVHEINDHLTSIIRAGQEDATIRADINPRLYGCLIGNLTTSFGSRTALRREILRRNQKIDPYEEYCLVLDLILESLKIC